MATWPMHGRKKKMHNIDYMSDWMTGNKGVMMLYSMSFYTIAIYPINGRPFQKLFRGGIHESELKGFHYMELDDLFSTHLCPEMSFSFRLIEQ